MTSLETAQNSTNSPIAAHAPGEVANSPNSPEASPNSPGASIAEPPAAPAATASSSAGAPDAPNAHHDDSPEPGNRAVAPRHADDDDDSDGPMPGNEKFPEEAASGAQAKLAAPGDGTGKRKRRRRKKGAGDPSRVGAAGEAAPGTTGNDAPAEQKRGERRGHHGRPGREGGRDGSRPFVVGDEVFGRIIEILDEVIVIDLPGKGGAIFDKRELSIDDAALAAVEQAVAAEAAEDQRGAAGETAVAPETALASEKMAGEGAPVSLAAESAAVVEAAPAPADELPASVLPELAHASEDMAAEGAPVSPTAESAEAVDSSAAAAAHAATEAAPVAPPRAPLPPVVLEVGASFVGFVHNDGGRGGLVVLTRHPKRASRIKPIVAAALRDGSTIEALVTGVIKGGVEVDIDGLRAFCPASHMDLRLGADLGQWVAKRLPFHVTQYAKRGRDVVLSRKPILEVAAKAQREEALKTLTVGAVVEGTVRSVVSFGAFIDIGGIEGLVPLTEMSHNRSDTPADVFKMNTPTQVKILKIDDRGKVWLSHRATIPDPWVEATQKYALGSKHKGKAVRLQPFGVFVELEPGIDGLIHTSDLSTARIEHPNEVVKVGDELDVVVAVLDIGAHKIGLHPALTGAAADEAPQRVVAHKPVKVVVVTVEIGGLNVRVLGVTGRHARGFIPASATGTARGTDLKKQFPMGTQLEAKVMEIDPRRGEIKLSIRALTDETERSAYNQYRAQVTKQAKFTLGDLIARSREGK